MAERDENEEVLPAPEAEPELGESLDLIQFEHPEEKEEAEDVDIEEELQDRNPYHTQKTDGHTYNLGDAVDQGLTYTPPTDPPVVPSKDDPQGAEVAAGFALSMESSNPDVRDLPDHVDNNDFDLEEDIYTALRYNSETQHLTDIEVQVDNGLVTLNGTVTSEEDIPIVYDIVSDLEGVVEIQMNLQVEE